MKNDEFLEKFEAENVRAYDSFAAAFAGTRAFLWDDFSHPAFVDGLSQGDRVLDAGAGEGRLCRLVQPLGANYFGLDSSRELISIAKKNFPEASFSVGDLRSLPYENNFFRRVYCLAALPHLLSGSSRALFWSEVARVLRPDGDLVLLTWNLRSEFADRELKKGKRIEVAENVFEIPWREGDRLVGLRYYAHLPPEILAKEACQYGLKLRLGVGLKRGVAMTDLDNVDNFLSVFER